MNSHPKISSCREKQSGGLSSMIIMKKKRNKENLSIEKSEKQTELETISSLIMSRIWVKII